MSEQVVLITGANSGVGFAAAHQFAELGHHVVMICRDPQRGDAARIKIAREAVGPAPTLMIADLSSQKAIRELADEIYSKFNRLDVLVNNAAGIFSRRELTTDGIERTFALNHLAPFLLTNLLVDRLRVAPAARIVNVTSESHSGKIDFDNLQGEHRYNFFTAYNRSKLGNILFTYELARRLEGERITANCVSPGPTVTRFGDNMSGLPRLFPLLMKRIPFLFHSPEVGARTLIYAATSSEIAGVSGRFFLKCRERKSKAVTYNSDVAARLWKISDEMCGGGCDKYISSRQARETGTFRKPSNTNRRELQKEIQV
jgi:NAD(P)-dependent dehydrogenase (short-subunit alcohol dehydrogenase family)